MLGLSERLRSKRSQAQDSNNNGGQSAAQSQSSRKISIRDRLLVKEVADLTPGSLPPTCVVRWPDPDSLHEIQLAITPDEGYWQGGVFQFRINVPDEYNMAPPSVRCATRLWHPNINEDGAVCLSLLRQSPFDELGWAPTRRIRDVVLGLSQLFTDLLNFDEPLNSDAADQYRQDEEGFARKVRSFIKEYCHSSSSHHERRDSKKK